ncbi:MAG TPA: efflux RND transporter periplasmic adaptor subunit [Stellaceae bacterium]|nr:efflux RND transporter periplasmic adaptor subunit [Stellaceae bacterium]
MSEHDSPPSLEAPQPRRDRGDAKPPPGAPTRPVGRGSRRLALGVLVLLAGALTLGIGRHYAQHRQVIADARQEANFVPSVRVDTVTAPPAHTVVTLPGTTLAFEQANIYARASGYVAKRYVDIGDHVKAGQLLAEIAAPEVEDQVAQYLNSLQQAQALLRQNEANRALAAITNRRTSILTRAGTASQQQSDNDRYNFAAQQQATAAAEFSAAATQAQLRVTNQQKVYQKVVAPFDGTISQRNIDVGSLITADATSGTAMFAEVHSDVIRVWVYVPQDSAFGVSPGVDAVIRVPAMPNLTFHGKVTRIANALQPGTRTLLTEIDVPNPDGALTPGVYCMVDMAIPRTSPALLVPASAIIFNQNGMQVAVVANGVAHLRKIAITTDYGTEVEVSQGVKAGDEVVLQPPVNLADGQKVHVQPGPPTP